MEDFHFYTLSLTLLALYYYFIRRLYSGAGSGASPPSPPSLPIIGNLHQFGALPHRSLFDLSKKYGPIMLLRLGMKPALVVSSARVAKEVLRTHDLTFADKGATYDVKKVFYDATDVFNSPYGERWRRLRVLVVNELLTTSRVNSFASVRAEEVAQLVRRIEGHGGSPVNLSEGFAAVANDLISRAAFGKKHGESEHGRKFLELVQESAGLLGKFSVGEFIPWLAWIDRLNGRYAALDRVAEMRDEILDAIVEDHMQNLESACKQKQNMMDILLGIYRGQSPGLTIDLLSLKSLILVNSNIIGSDFLLHFSYYIFYRYMQDVFTAGTDTTTTTLTWLMTELLRHPKIMRKLQDEVRGVMKGKKHGTISDDDLKEMHYLKAVIKETLRLHPPVAIFLHAARDHVNLMGYEVAPETLVIVNVWAIAHDPASWVEPKEFMPERFLDSSVDFKGLDFHLIPFGSGRRMCPGIGFAILAVEHTIANLMLKFDWALPGQARGEDLDVIERPGITIGRRNPLIVVATANPEA